MISKKNLYCRLEIFCIYEIEAAPFARKEKSLSIQNNEELKTVEDYDVYVEEYQDFILVRNRIIELGIIWKELHSEVETSWTEEDRKACYAGNKESGRSLYISVLLYNCWGDHIIVGISHAGWVIPAVSCYTLEYENNLIELGDIDFSRQRIFVIFTPQVTEFFECEFISQEVACLLIKEWLDNGTYKKHSVNQKIIPGDLNKTDVYHNTIPF